MKLPPEAPAPRLAVPLINVRLDLAVGPNHVDEGWKVIGLPALPQVQEGLIVDGEKLGILARVHEVTTEGAGYLCILLVARIQQGIVAAPASALIGLNGRKV